MTSNLNPVELGLPPPGDEDVGAFRDEPLCGGKANSTTATRNHRDFSIKATHSEVPFASTR